MSMQLREILLTRSQLLSLLAFRTLNSLYGVTGACPLTVNRHAPCMYKAVGQIRRRPSAPVLPRPLLVCLHSADPDLLPSGQHSAQTLVSQLNVACPLRVVLDFLNHFVRDIQTPVRLSVNSTVTLTHCKCRSERQSVKLLYKKVKGLINKKKVTNQKKNKRYEQAIYI